MAPMRPSPEALQFWSVLRQPPAQVSLLIKERREAGEHAEDGTEEPQGEVSARVLYLFGGGHVLGSPASRQTTAGHLAVAAPIDRGGGRPH